MNIRRKIEAWIVHRILLRNFGRMRLQDGTVAVHQSAEFNAWCYSDGYLIFNEQRKDQP